MKTGGRGSTVTVVAGYMKRLSVLLIPVLWLLMDVLFLFLCRFLNSCGCSTAKSMTPPDETFFYPLNGSERGSHPSLTTRDRELVSVLEVRIEYGDLNQGPLTPQSATLPTPPRAGCSKASILDNLL